MQFWVPIGATGIAAALTVWADILAGRRKRAKAKREAAARFRAAFAEAFAQLDYIDAHAFITDTNDEHDAAILAFRRQLDSKQLPDFDAAVQKFYRRRKEVQPAPVKVRASLESGKPTDNSDTVNLKQTLEELLIFADDAYARSVVSDQQHSGSPPDAKLDGRSK